MSEYPDKDFRYGGVIISNGDVGYQGRAPEERLNTTGNNHGSIEYINGQWYVFYHRHTHNRSCCRQACAEKIIIMQDGSIPQVEMTSTGMRAEPFGAGEYPAVIACNLRHGRMKHIVNGISKADKPCISSDGSERFIANIKDGTKIGYKYFQMNGAMRIGVISRGNASGVLKISANGKQIGTLQITPGRRWNEATGTIFYEGTAVLELSYHGRGKMDMLSFSLSKEDK